MAPPSGSTGLVLANTRAGADTPEGAAGRRALAERLRAEGNGFLVAERRRRCCGRTPPARSGRVRGMIADQPAEAIAAAALGMAERPDSTPDLACDRRPDARSSPRTATP